MLKRKVIDLTGDLDPSIHKRPRIWQGLAVVPPSPGNGSSATLPATTLVIPAECDQREAGPVGTATGRPSHDWKPSASETPDNTRAPPASGGDKIEEAVGGRRTEAKTPAMSSCNAPVSSGTPNDPPTPALCDGKMAEVAGGASMDATAEACNASVPLTPGRVPLVPGPVLGTVVSPSLRPFVPLSPSPSFSLPSAEGSVAVGDVKMHEPTAVPPATAPVRSDGAAHARSGKGIAPPSAERIGKAKKRKRVSPPEDLDVQDCEPDPYLAKLPHCPIFYPTPEQFSRPFEYLMKCREKAGHCGMCIIQSPVASDMSNEELRNMFMTRIFDNCANAGTGDELRFKTKIQNIHQLMHRFEGPAEKFIDRLYSFYADNHLDIPKDLPRPNYTPLDLYRLYQAVEKLGGFYAVQRSNNWAKVCSACNVPQSLPKRLKNVYFRYLLDFETFEREEREGRQQPKKTGHVTSTAGAADTIAAPRADTERASTAAASPAPNHSASFAPQCAPATGCAAAPVQDMAAPAGFVAARAESSNAPASNAPAPARGKSVRTPSPRVGAAAARPDKVRGSASSGAMVDALDACGVVEELHDPAGISGKGGKVSGEEWTENSADEDRAGRASGERGSEDWDVIKTGSKGSVFRTSTFGYQTGRSYTLEEYETHAKKFKLAVFGKRVPKDVFGMPELSVPVNALERRYWSAVDSGDEYLQTEYGSDVCTKDAKTSGYERVMDLGTADMQKVLLSPPGWNQNTLAKVNGSLMAQESTDLPGISSPYMYIGMLFSSFCWHVEDDFMYSINLMHMGFPKRWYGVPSSHAEAFEAAAREVVPGLFEENPALLHTLVTQIHPRHLVERGVPVYTALQQPGQIAVTFPRAYHAGFSHGFNAAESCNVCPADWLPDLYKASQVYRVTIPPRRPAFPLEQYVLGVASAYILNGAVLSRAVPVIRSVITEVINSQQELLLKGVGHMKNVPPRARTDGFTTTVACKVCQYDLHLSYVTREAPRHASRRYLEEAYCLRHALEIPPDALKEMTLWFRFDTMELQNTLRFWEYQLENTPDDLGPCDFEHPLSIYIRAPTAGLEHAV
eukprot:CAMPEP_0119128478 /NCGR_PEP_ID=MMETSP1310-20130426/6616_1 /TAXON_ID=464262 /ORGANISM="Genus nov. species nov., Strain RCC2339" /LENGTH=1075 /DNA_ID=CAMNT_0007118821 /DNA_START=149 /DNA_END=3377 /DNA_ORIENTATION=+